MSRSQLGMLTGMVFGGGERSRRVVDFAWSCAGVIVIFPPQNFYPRTMSNPPPSTSFLPLDALFNNPLFAGGLGLAGLGAVAALGRRSVIQGTFPQRCLCRRIEAPGCIVLTSPRSLTNKATSTHRYAGPIPLFLPHCRGRLDIVPVRSEQC